MKPQRPGVELRPRAASSDCVRSGLVQSGFWLVDRQVWTVDLVRALADQRIQDLPRTADVAEANCQLICSRIAGQLGRLIIWIAIFWIETDVACLDVSFRDSAALNSSKHLADAAGGIRKLQSPWERAKPPPH